ncbi:MAG: DUF1826 domain-containing protein [Candidatus Sericytochromatia bacterium]|nr:DUF1826 domain-containing protein [Candidatus Tanganyikabacteria bacterium]
MTPVLTQPSWRRVSDVAAAVAVFRADINVVVVPAPLTEAIVAEALAIRDRPGCATMDVVEWGNRTIEAPRVLAEWPALGRDLDQWLELLHDLTGCPAIGVRLERATSAMCPRFHVDRVTLRLVRTYAGLGTEWLDEKDVLRDLLGHPGADAGRDGGMKPGGSLLRAKPGDVVLLKGEAWPGQNGRGAVHRSPSATPDAPRVILTLDALA